LIGKTQGFAGQIVYLAGQDLSFQQGQIVRFALLLHAQTRRRLVEQIDGLPTRNERRRDFGQVPTREAEEKKGEISDKSQQQ
jgi:hypothetical protein